MENRKQENSNALETCRPHNSVMIVLAGITGSGKSSLINTLFSLPSQPLGYLNFGPVQVFRRKFLISEGLSTSEQKLSIIEMNNSASDNGLKAKDILVRALTECGDILNRYTFDEFDSTMAPSVYPNIFLFTLSATENRIRGNHSAIRIFLEQIMLTESLVDTTFNNMIVVVTNACALGLNKLVFQEKFAMLAEHISSVILDVFGIRNIQIVPVEIDSAAYNLEVFQTSCILPNGETTPLNLMKAMIELSNRNQDKILSLALLNTQETGASKSSVESTLYKPSVLGHGYCPVEEELKTFTVLDMEGIPDNSFETTVLGENIMHFPNCIKLILNGFSNVWQTSTAVTKASYEQSVKNKYFMCTETELNVTGASNGRWLDETKLNDPEYSYKQGFRMALLRLNMGSLSLKLETLLSILNGLPDTYTGKTMPAFMDFFDTFGTHFVIETSIGGSLELKTSIRHNVLTTHSTNQLTENLVKIFQKLFFEGINQSDAQEYLRGIGAIDEKIHLEGGNSENLHHLNQLNNVNTKNWIKSIRSQPVESRHDIKLKPYYDLVNNSQKFKTLQKATYEFLSGRLNQEKIVYNSKSRRDLSRAGLFRARSLSVELMDDDSNPNIEV